MTYVQTVSGPVDPAEIERILPHEHLLSLTPGPWLSGGRGPADPEGRQAGAWEEDQIETAVGALSGLLESGYNTVVDLSPYGVVGRDAQGHNVTLLARIAERTGLHIVTGTSVYLEAFSPPWTVEASLDELTRRFVRDAREGVGGTGIRAGILGEQATGLGAMTAHEEKCLRAAARAHRETGLAINTHTTHGTLALEQLDILGQEGADLSRVIIGHVDTHPDHDQVRAIADRGVAIAFDTIGKQYWDFRVAPLPADQPPGPFTKNAFHQPDELRADRIADLVRRGHLEQILLSHDLTGEEVYLNPGTHGQWGLRYLDRFSTMLLERGITEQQIMIMTRDNPLRFLTLTA
jgi:phosphotriesterase-related protein